MSTKKADVGMFGSFLALLLSLFTSNKFRDKIAEIDHKTLDDIIQLRSHTTESLVDEFIEFLNRRARVVLSWVIDFDEKPYNTGCHLKLNEHTGVKGELPFDATKIKAIPAISMFNDGEDLISGEEFYSRLKEAGYIFYNSNLGRFLAEHRTQLPVRNFLREYEGKQLHCYGHIMADLGYPVHSGMRNALCIFGGKNANSYWNFMGNWIRKNDFALVYVE